MSKGAKLSRYVMLVINDGSGTENEAEQENLSMMTDVINTTKLEVAIFVLKMMNIVLKRLNFVFKMTNVMQTPRRSLGTSRLTRRI